MELREEVNWLPRSNLKVKVSTRSVGREEEKEAPVRTGLAPSPPPKRPPTKRKETVVSVPLSNFHTQTNKEISYETI